jgi:hypothetical protein
MLLLTLGVIWGAPYLMIRIAVASVDPLIVAIGRTLIGSLLLLPLALHRGALAPAFRRWQALLAFTLVEISGPWLLLGHAETRINSSTAGLLLAVIPMLSAVIVAMLGHERLEGRRLAGLVIGFAGVAILVGVDIRLEDLLAVGATVLCALGYAIGPIIIDRKLKDVPPLGGHHRVAHRGDRALCADRSPRVARFDSGLRGAFHRRPGCHVHRGGIPALLRADRGDRGDRARARHTRGLHQSRRGHRAGRDRAERAAHARHGDRVPAGAAGNRHGHRAVG